MLQKPPFNLCGNLNKIVLANELQMNYFYASLSQHDFNHFSNLSRLILKKGGFYTSVSQPQKNKFSTEKSTVEPL